MRDVWWRWEDGLAGWMWEIISLDGNGPRRHPSLLNLARFAGEPYFQCRSRRCDTIRRACSTTFAHIMMAPDQEIQHEQRCPTGAEWTMRVMGDG